jgi:hypothetical protein
VYKNINLLFKYNLNNIMNLLISGCGGGHDIYCGIPIFLKKKDSGHSVFILNLSFTDITIIKTLVNYEKIHNFCYYFNYEDNIEDRHGSQYEFDYFPEYYLSKELGVGIYLILPEFFDTITSNDNRMVFCSIQDIIDIYKIIIEKHLINEIYLIDGGCDVILSGYENEIGTPTEDVLHLTGIVRCLLYYPFNVELFIGAIGMDCDVGKEQGLEDLRHRLLYLNSQNVIISFDIWNSDNPYVEEYQGIFNNLLTNGNSIINSMINSAINGFTGDYLPPELQNRIINSKINMGNLTKAFFMFKGKEIYNHIPYITSLSNEMKINEIETYIDTILV